MLEVSELEPLSHPKIFVYLGFTCSLSLLDNGAGYFAEAAIIITKKFLYAARICRSSYTHSVT